jgi:carbonic anhydrase
MGNYLKPMILSEADKLERGQMCLKYDVWKNPIISCKNDYLCIQDTNIEENKQDSLLYFDGLKYKLVEIIIRKTSYILNNKNYIIEVDFVHKNINNYSPLDYIIFIVLLKQKDNLQINYSFWDSICESSNLPKKIFNNKNKTYWIGTSKNPKILNLNNFVKMLNYNKLIKYSHLKKYFKDFKIHNVKYIIIESNLNDSQLNKFK